MRLRNPEAFNPLPVAAAEEITKALLGPGSLSPNIY